MADSNKSMDVYRKDGLRSVRREIETIHRGIDRLFEDVLGEAFPPSFWSRPGFGLGLGGFMPAVDVEESDDHYLISMDLPGVSKDDVHVDIRDNQLMVWGERKEEHEDKGKNRYFMERSYGSFQRSFALPSDVDLDKIEADFSDGVLRIGLGKTEGAQGRSVPIGGKSGGLLSRIFGEGREQKDVRQQQQKKDIEVGKKSA